MSCSGRRQVDDAKQSTENLDDEETDRKTRRRFLLRFYRVWNEQRELPQVVLDKLPKIETHDYDPVEAAERNYRAALAQRRERRL